MLVDFLLAVHKHTFFNIYGWFQTKEAIFAGCVGYACFMLVAWMPGRSHILVP